MPTLTAKIGYNSRGPWASTTADYRYMDTVTSVVGGATNLYEVISPAYPGTVPAGTPVTNTTYFRLLVAGATGATGAKGDTGNLPLVEITAAAYAAIVPAPTDNKLYVITG